MPDFNPLDPQSMIPALQGVSNRPLAEMDPIAEMLRAMNYQKGMEQLKFGMTPAIQGHDYVPPYAKFDDSSTIQDKGRNFDAGGADINRLKNAEAEFQLRNMSPQPANPMFTYPPGYNGNNRT